MNEAVNQNIRIAPCGLIGDRVTTGHRDWQPGSLMYDLAGEQSKVVDGAILYALNAIEWRVPGNDELQAGLGKILHDPTNNVLVTILWKGNPILEVYAPEYGIQGNKRTVTRKIRQVWMKSNDHKRG